MRKLAAVVAVASLVVGSLTVAATAQQTSPTTRDQQTQQRQDASRNDQGLSKGLKPGTVKASDLIGKNVENQNGDNLGEIKDLVLDRSANKVAFVVFQPSARLFQNEPARTATPATPPAGAPATAPRTDAARADNPRDKYYALPLTDFKESGKKLTMSVDASHLSKAASFPSNQWPDLADSTWTSKVYKAEGSQAELIRAHDFMKKSVRNDQNQKLGSIDEIVLDMSSGKILYAVLAEGGILGLGEKLFAIPISAFKPTNDHKDLVLAADKDRLKSAQGFDKHNWPATASRGWTQGS